jgi:hypothetical protein
MYLISPDYLNRNERSATLQQESSPFQNAAKSTNPKKKTRARVNRKKKKGPQHPYDKWVAIRGEIAEAAVRRKALIKAIADFIKAILPDTTLAEKITTPRSESIELVTQTDMNLATPPPRSAPVPSTSSAGDVVYETETSPFSAGFTRALPTALAYDDDADTGAVSNDVDTGAVSKDVDTSETRKYARKSFGATASPYLSSYVHKSGVLDAE